MLRIVSVKTKIMTEKQYSRFAGKYARAAIFSLIYLPVFS